MSEEKVNIFISDKINCPYISEKKENCIGKKYCLVIDETEDIKCSGFRKIKENDLFQKMGIVNVRKMKNYMIESVETCNNYKNIFKEMNISLDKRNIIWLEGLYIFDKFRPKKLGGDGTAQGLGQKMLHAILKEFSNIGFKTIILQPSGPKELINYYKNIGFHLLEDCLYVDSDFLYILGLDPNNEEDWNQEAIEDFKNLPNESKKNIFRDKNIDTTYLMIGDISTVLEKTKFSIDYLLTHEDLD